MRDFSNCFQTPTKYNIDYTRIALIYTFRFSVLSNKCISVIKRKEKKIRKFDRNQIDNITQTLYKIQLKQDACFPVYFKFLKYYLAISKILLSTITLVIQKCLFLEHLIL